MQLRLGYLAIRRHHLELLIRPMGEGDARRGAQPAVIGNWKRHVVFVLYTKAINFFVFSIIFSVKKSWIFSILLPKNIDWNYILNQQTAQTLCIFIGAAKSNIGQTTQSQRNCQPKDHSLLLNTANRIYNAQCHILTLSFLHLHNIYKFQFPCQRPHSSGTSRRRFVVWCGAAWSFIFIPQHTQPSILYVGRPVRNNNVLSRWWRSYVYLYIYR